MNEQILSELMAAWSARAASAHPSDAMLINKHIRELKEAQIKSSHAPVERQAPEWISVEDRLPEDDDTFLVASWKRLDNTSNMSVAGFHRGTGTFSEFFNARITHWMPLPASPSAAPSAQGRSEG